MGRVEGNMKRNVEDKEIYMQVMQRKDRSDGMRMKYKDIEWMKIEIEVKGLKIGIWIDEGFEEKVGGKK